MTDTIDNLVEKAKKLARSGDDAEAMAIANELIADYPNEMSVWMLRGHLHELSNNYKDAIADLTRAEEKEHLKKLGIDPDAEIPE